MCAYTSQKRCLHLITGRASVDSDYFYPHCFDTADECLQMPVLKDPTIATVVSWGPKEKFDPTVFGQLQVGLSSLWQLLPFEFREWLFQLCEGSMGPAEEKPRPPSRGSPIFTISHISHIHEP